VILKTGKRKDFGTMEVNQDGTR